MKYKRIIWWKNPSNNSEINLAQNYCKNKKIIMTIVDNIDDFINSLDTESFIVLSVLHADKYFDEIINVIKKFPAQKFHLHWRMDENDYTLNEMKLLTHPNVVKPEDYSILLKLAEG